MAFTTRATQLTSEMTTALSEQVPPGCIDRTVGTIEYLLEIPVAAAGADRSVLSETSVRDLTNEAAAQAKRDPGMGALNDRKALGTQLAPTRTSHGQTSTIALLNKMTPLWSGAYLSHWCSHFRELEAGTAADFLGYRDSSALLIAHLIGANLSPDIIKRQIDYMRSQPATFDASDVINAFADRIKAGKRPVEVLFILEQTIPQGITGIQSMTAGEVRQWADKRGLTTTLPDHFHGAVSMQGYAWDKYHLRELATQARLSLIDRTRAKIGRDILVSRIAITNAFDHRINCSDQEDSHARVGRYDLTTMALNATASSDVSEVAMEFFTAAARAHSQASRTALLWAAVESLFSEPGTNNMASASHAANIASIRQAKRFVGIGMTMLGGGRGDPGYATRVVNLGQEEQYALFTTYLQDNHFANIASPQCRSFMDHLRLRVTERGLISYRDNLESHLRHLYRGRNLAVHGGVTDSPMLAIVNSLSEPIVAVVLDYLSAETLRARPELLVRMGEVSLFIEQMRARSASKESTPNATLAYADLFS
jgi:hypothetical protein